MKILKTFENFNSTWVVDDVEYTEYGDIISIKLTNGFELIPEEDTGGEFAILDIEGYKLKKGDHISFDDNYSDNDSSYHMTNLSTNRDEIWGIESININNVKYPATVGSEGGNPSAYLVYRKIQPQGEVESQPQREEFEFKISPSDENIDDLSQWKKLYDSGYRVYTGKWDKDLETISKMLSEHGLEVEVKQSKNTFIYRIKSI